MGMVRKSRTGMPYKIRKLPGKKKYKVTGPGKKVLARSTTLRKAKKQVKLLYGIKHGWKPTGKGF